MSNTERLDAIRAALDEVDSPSPIPVGAPGSMMRRAWELGRERQATARELERWRHGQQIEGDYVCPDTLALAATEKERDAAVARAEKAEAAEAAALWNATRIECANPDFDDDTDREIMCDCCTAMHDRRKAAVDPLRKGGA